MNILLLVKTYLAYETLVERQRCKTIKFVLAHEPTVTETRLELRRIAIRMALHGAEAEDSRMGLCHTEAAESVRKTNAHAV